MSIDKSLSQYQQLVKKGNGNKRPGYRGDDWGGPSYGGSSSKSSSGGNGSHDRGGGQHRAAAQKAAPAKAPEPDRRSIALANQYVEPVIAQPTIDTGPKRDMHDFEIKKRGITTVTGGGPHTEGPIDRIVYQPTDLPKRTYDPRTDPNALLDRGGGILKGLGTAAASVFLPMLLPAKAAAAYKMYNTAKTASAFAKKFGVTDKDVVQTLTNKVLDKDILKQTQKDDIPKVADRHPGTDKKKKTTREPKDGDGVNRILPKSLQSTVSEGMQQFLSDKQKEQYLVAQNKMKAALAEGYYVDQNGKRIALDDEQVNTLTQLITRIDSLLVDPVMMADGGRVDKALGGRVRDI